MKVPSPAAMAGLLRARLDEGGDPDRVVTLAELVDVILPYAAARAAFQLAGKAEYDLAVLGLLASRDHLQVDPAVLDAVQTELEEGEPGLGFAAGLGDSVLRLRTAAPRRRSRGPFTLVEPEGADEPEPDAEPADPEREAGTDPDRDAGGATPDGPVPEPALPPAEEVAPGPARYEVAREEELGSRSDRPAPGRAPTVDPVPVSASPAAIEPASQPTPSDRLRPEPEWPGPETARNVDPPAREEERVEAREPALPEPFVEARPCRSCGADLPPRDGVRFCPACGASQREPRCNDCGDRVEAGWRFCARCGRELGGP